MINIIIKEYLQIEIWVSDHPFTHLCTHKFTGISIISGIWYGITVRLDHVENNYDIKNAHNIWVRICYHN